MRRWEDGSALIEAIFVGMVLILPIVWGLILLSDAHRGALALTAAAREGGLDAVRSRAAPEAVGEASKAVAGALSDHGFDPELARMKFLEMDLTRGGRVEIEVAYPIPLIRLPFFDSDLGPSFWISAHHSARVDPYRSLP